MKETLLEKIRKFLKENPHVWWALYLPVYLISYFVVEHVVDGSAPYWVSWMPLDDKIPFLEGFVMAYCMWYPLLVATGIWLMLKDGHAFRRYMQFIAIGFSLSTLFCFLVPNGQNLRPEVFPRDNVFTALLGRIYAADTNTNVFPSVHVVGCIAAIFGAFDSDTLKKMRIPMILAGILISCSTVFVKQHSALDIFGALALCLPIWVCLWAARRKDNQHEETLAAQKNQAAAKDHP